MFICFCFIKLNFFRHLIALRNWMPPLNSLLSLIKVCRHLFWVQSHPTNRGAQEFLTVFKIFCYRMLQSVKKALTLQSV